LEVVSPRPEAALALVGCARRLGITAKTKESRGMDRVVIRDGEAIGALLTRMGALQGRLEWEEKRQRRQVRTSSNRLANFDDANLRRSARAAVAAAARVERAMQILGDDVPEHLAEAGQLRVQHRHASLEELGRLADPQMTKDAVAGRIRRLLSMADKQAEELGVSDTHSAVTEDIFES
ncbi:MAG TPA: DNA-binding protein WhiA, partial [Corynebacterium sp.]|nr:DNA-binding protein WhiA [Corynebacterium sp.]